MAEAGEHRFHVRLFGRARVYGPDGLIRLSPHQLALVVLVFGHGPGGLSRARAIQLIWGASSDSRARHRLRQLLAEVRGRVSGAFIEADVAELRPGALVTCDVTSFKGRLTDGPLVETARQIRSGFAEGSPDSLAEGFEDWRVQFHRELLRDFRIRALSRWRQASRSSEWPLASDAAEALWILEPENADHAARVIDACGMLGQTEAAERVFEECLEHGESPEPSKALLDAIGRVRALGSLGHWTDSARDEMPLVGRRDALASARAVLEDARGDRFVFMLISGEAGIGKTRLLRELHREAVLRGLRCLSAEAAELECRIPLNPLLDALKSMDLTRYLGELGAPWDAVVGSMLPAAAPGKPAEAPPPIQETALPRRLLDAFALLFEQIAVDQPTVLFLDDLQWADTTTVTALQFMQRRWRRGSLIVIATTRPESSQPSRTAYLSGSSGPPIHRIELAELSPDEAVRLVEQVADDEVSRDVAQRICELAGFHPLYLTELTRDYLAGQLRLPEQPIEEVAIPLSLKQILATRLAGLTTEAFKIGGLLAVAGRPVALVNLARLGGLPPDRVADLVDELRRSRLVSCEQDRVAVAHELFRSAIYGELTDLRRALNHRAVAQLILTEESDAPPGELAAHFSRAGEVELAARYGWSAAELAMESGAVAEAAHFYEMVVENDHDAIRRAEATAALARALYLARDLGRATPLLELAAVRLNAIGRPSEALRSEIRRVEGLAEVGASTLGDLLGRLREIKRDARDRADWEGVALALDVELHLLHRVGDLPAIDGLFLEMRDVAQRDSLEGTLLASAGLALGVLFGDPDEALEAAQRAVSLSAAGRSYRLRALQRLMVVLQHRGMLNLPGSPPIVREARWMAQDSGDLLLRFSIESNLAVAALDAGDLHRADVLMARARTLAGSGDMDLNRCIQANNRAELALANQEYSHALGAYGEAMAYLADGTPSYMADLINAGIGLCALETGELAEARRREESLGPPPARWYYDPTTIVAFRTRVLQRRGSIEQALDLLAGVASDLEGRLTLAWLKVQALRARMLRKAGESSATRSVAGSALKRATDLRLPYRVAEFEGLVASLEG